MNLETLGQVLVETEVVVEPESVALLVDALGTPTAGEVALRLPFFGPTVGGSDSVVGPIGLSLERGLAGGQSFEWHRSFRLGERVSVVVSVEDIIDKGTLHLATVLSEYRDADGELIQRQRTVFVERKPADSSEDSDAAVDERSAGAAST
ncbi:FAS1-like dehydratase domain-containing protein [Candidatus Poriferisodalis sp.]|uniref:FAS1-like dehydratase domain-containing protein n=1 Tax=Candidatus Poriferisodalis sp. TaxID=3101277 RepID=UPI003B5B1710